MEITGQYRLNVPQDKVWAALNDPVVLKASLPGCESLEKTSETEMVAVMKTKVGPISATFKGKVALSDLDPPNGYKITGEGSGGVAGFAKGGADVKLAKSDDGATILSYSASAQVGGKLAQIGSRLIDATARQMADEFFSRFSRNVQVEQPTVAASPDAAMTGPLVEVSTDSPAPDSPVNFLRAVQKKVWVGIVGGIALVVLLILIQ